MANRARAADAAGIWRASVMAEGLAVPVEASDGGESARGSRRRSGRGLIAFWAATGLVVLFRVRFVLDADSLLDSDLAVDGLAIRELASGRWLWHFPGTPALGIAHGLPAWVWSWRGIDSQTLMLGGLTTTLLVAVGVWLLAGSLFGDGRAAVVALVPIALPTSGVLWLSSRLTGGHLLTVAWYAFTLWLAHSAVTRGGWMRVALFGVVAGFGIWLDPLSVLGLIGLIPALVGQGFRPGGFWRRLAMVVLWSACFGAGLAPRVIGAMRDGYDAYVGQERTILDAEPLNRGGGAIAFSGTNWKVVGELARKHARILAAECLPRLLIGRRLPGLEFDPAPGALVGRVSGGGGARSPVDLLAAASVVGFGAIGVVSLYGLWVLARGRDALFIAQAMVVTGFATLTAFILHLNIFNSDNYRYLVLLIVPLCVGFASALRGVLGGSGARRWLGGAFFAAVCLVPPLDTARWCMVYLGEVDRAAIEADRALFDQLAANGGIRSIYGNYWDVYRVSFLTGGRITAIPYPVYPSRFPVAAHAAYKEPGRYMLARKNDQYGVYYRRQALMEGGRLVVETPDAWVYEWPPGRGGR